MMIDQNAKPWSEDMPRRDALVLDLIELATATAPSEGDAASALLRSAATVLSKHFDEEAVCDLMIVALLETKATVHRKRRAH